MASLYVLPYVLSSESLACAAGQTSLTHTGRATAILVTRFLLDLQQASRRAMHLPAMNTENWEKVMGSLVLVSLERGEEDDEGERLGMGICGQRGEIIWDVFGIRGSLT